MHIEVTKEEFRSLFDHAEAIFSVREYYPSGPERIAELLSKKDMYLLCPSLYCIRKERLHKLLTEEELVLFKMTHPNNSLTVLLPGEEA